VAPSALCGYPSPRRDPSAVALGRQEWVTPPRTRANPSRRIDVSPVRPFEKVLRQRASGLDVDDNGGDLASSSRLPVFVVLVSVHIEPKPGPGYPEVLAALVRVRTRQECSKAPQMTAARNCRRLRDSDSKSPLHTTARPPDCLADNRAPDRLSQCARGWPRCSRAQARTVSLESG
jgi:hypothetical protein